MWSVWVYIIIVKSESECVCLFVCLSVVHCRQYDIRALAIACKSLSCDMGGPEKGRWFWVGV